MKKRRPVVYDFLCENTELRKCNCYVEEFCSMSPLQQLRNDLASHEQQPSSSPHPWRSFFNKSELKKEVTEAMSIATRVRNFLSQHPFDQIICFDICCGKGYSSICTVECCGGRDKDMQLFMLDCNKHLKMDYLHPLYSPQCHFVPFTIQKETNNLYTFVQQQCVSLIKDSSKQVAIILFGNHLCNFLSEQFVDCVQRLCAAPQEKKNLLALLSPCCSYENPNNTMYYQQFGQNRPLLEQVFAKEFISTSLEQYDTHYLIWVYYLKQLCKQGVVRIEQDSLVLSNKNLYLIWEHLQSTA